MHPEQRLPLEAYSLKDLIEMSGSKLRGDDATLSGKPIDSLTREDINKLMGCFAGDLHDAEVWRTRTDLTPYEQRELDRITKTEPLLEEICDRLGERRAALSEAAKADELELIEKEYQGKTPMELARTAIQLLKLQIEIQEEGEKLRSGDLPSNYEIKHTMSLPEIKKRVAVVERLLAE